MTEESISRLIRNLNVATSNLQIYPKENALVKDTLKSAYISLNEILASIDSIILSEADKNLLVNGKNIELKSATQAAVDLIIENFIRNNIKSITILKGITLEELTNFLEILSKKKEGKEDSISKLIKMQRITHIAVNEKVYVAVGEDDKTKEAGKEMYIDLTREERKFGWINIEEEKTVKEVKVEQRIPPRKSKTEIIIEDTQSLLKEEKESLLEVEPEKLSTRLKELDTIERIDLVKDVVDKLATNLESTTDEVRLKATKSFKETLPVVESLSDKKVFDGLQEKFIVTEEKERNENVYNELAELLEYGVNKFLKEGNYEKTIEIVGMFRRHQSTKEEGFLKRWQIAEVVLSKISNPNITGILISDLKSEDTHRKEQAYSVIMKLQAGAVDSLIDAIKETEDIHLRKVIAFAIKNIGSSAMEKLINELDIQTPMETATKIIDCLSDIGSLEIIVKKLRDTFKHHNPVVRKEIMRTLIKIVPSSATEILTSAISDPEIAIKKEAISIFGKMKSKDAVDLLIPLLTQRSVFSKETYPPELLEEVCFTLGKIRDDRAVPALIKLARGATFFTLKKQFPKTVVLASISALAYFLLPEVKETLIDLKNNRDLAISKAAENSIEIQERISSKEDNPA